MPPTFYDVLQKKEDKARMTVFLPLNYDHRRFVTRQRLLEQNAAVRRRGQAFSSATMWITSRTATSGCNEAGPVVNQSGWDLPNVHPPHRGAV
jgi:hypothetical protein